MVAPAAICTVRLRYQGADAASSGAGAAGVLASVGGAGTLGAEGVAVVAVVGCFTRSGWITAVLIGVAAVSPFAEG